MFGKAAPKKCLPRITNATKKLPELTEKVWRGGLRTTFFLVTRGRSPGYFLQCNLEIKAAFAFFTLL